MLISDDDIELEDELADWNPDEEDEQLWLQLWWLEDRLLEDEENDFTIEMQLDEELHDVDFVEQLLLDEQQDTTLSEML